MEAGALVPSPGTATILPNSLSPKTRMKLSSGEALSITLNFFNVCLNASLLFKNISNSPSFSF